MLQVIRDVSSCVTYIVALHTLHAEVTGRTLTSVVCPQLHRFTIQIPMVSIHPTPALT